MTRKMFLNHGSFLTIAFAALISLAMGTSALAKGKSCTKTSRATLIACRDEVGNDFWIAIGKCNNLSSPNAGDECKAEARSERRDGLEDCAAQYDARQEVCEALGQAPYGPRIKPANFVDPAEIGKTVTPNPYFPLTLGTKWVYEGNGEKITVQVTGATKKILGVTCAAVHDVVQEIEGDRAEEDGKVIEDTYDWYAQDKNGNVWYFGEIAQEFEDGEIVSLEGSWKAGRDGAKPGILMKAHPQVGDVYRQEFALGEAEDLAEVLSLNERVKVPYGSFNGCLKTKDFTPLEPDVVEHKYYGLGVGSILEVNPEAGERAELVEFTTSF
jgi:hypothetical protein